MIRARVRTVGPGGRYYFATEVGGRLSVFILPSTVHEAGLDHLEIGDLLDVEYRQAERGPAATWIEAVR